MKYIVLSGCSGGMGLATAKKFSSNGYFVFGLDIKEPNVNIDNFVFIKTDLRDEKSIKKKLRFTVQAAPTVVFTRQGRRQTFFLRLILCPQKIMSVL